MVEFDVIFLELKIIMSTTRKFYNVAVGAIVSKNFKETNKDY